MTLPSPADGSADERATAEQRAELIERSRGRVHTEQGFQEFRKLVSEGTAREVDGALRHLRSVPPVSPCSWEVCAETTALLEARLDARADRQAVHRRNIRSAARALGRKVARGEATFADADARIERLLDVCDPELTLPVRLLPYEIGKRIAERSFVAAFHAIAKNRAS